MRAKSTRSLWGSPSPGDLALPILDVVLGARIARGSIVGVSCCTSRTAQSERSAAHLPLRWNSAPEPRAAEKPASPVLR
jgi:hypothetical protein